MWNRDMRQEEKVGLIVVLAIIGLFIARILLIGGNEYEYAKNGEIYMSKHCYQTDNGYCYCRLEDNSYINVDNYYPIR